MRTNTGGNDGNLIFEGVGDVQSDSDALIFLEPMRGIGGIDITTVVDPDKGAKVRGIFEPISFHIDEGRNVTQFKDAVPVPDWSPGAKSNKLTDEQIEDVIRDFLEEKGRAKQGEITDTMKGKPGLSYHRVLKVLNACSVHGEVGNQPGQIVYSVGQFNTKYYNVVPG